MAPRRSALAGLLAAALVVALAGSASGAGPAAQEAAEERVLSGTLLRSAMAEEQGVPQALRKAQANTEMEWDHLDIQVDNLDTSGLSEDDARSASSLVASAIQKVCGDDLEVFSLTPEADQVTFSSPKVCSWSPSHWEPSIGTSIMTIILIPERTASIVKMAIQSDQFQNELESVFSQLANTKMGPLQVNDIALLPVSPSDDNCNDGAMPSEPPPPSRNVSGGGKGTSLRASSASQGGGVQDDVYEADDVGEEQFRRVEMACSEISTHPRYGSPRYAPEGEAAGQVVCCSANGTSIRSVEGKCISEGGGFLKTYSEAVQTCRNYGFRLCRSAEELDRSCGKGCSLGGTLVWTSEQYKGQVQEFDNFVKGHAWTGWLDYLKDWRVDVASLLGLLLVFVLVFCLFRCFCADQGSRELLGQDAGDYSTSGPSYLNLWRMTVKRRPAGYTGDED